MNIFKRAWRSFLYRTRHIRVRLRVCGFGAKTNKRAWLVCVPNYSNIGDMAITVAEKKFLKRLGISFASLTIDECEDNVAMLKKTVRPDTLICYQGGGNLGNVYACDEGVRRLMLTELSQNPSVIFPQTLHFTDDEAGMSDAERASFIYGAHKKLTLALRDERSFESARKLFQNVSLIRSPDIVMGMNKKDLGIKEYERNGVLLCLRSDLEKALSEADKDRITARLTELGTVFAYTDMMAENDLVSQSEQLKKVSDKMREFSRASLVITDRLHGMIFSAITETPCIVFGNYNHKVEQSYRMLGHLEYIKFVKSVTEAEELIGEMYGYGGSYDRAPIMPKYGELEKIILEYTRKK